mgnify:CR=1 FL=1
MKKRRVDPNETKRHRKLMGPICAKGWHRTENSGAMIESVDNVVSGAPWYVFAGLVVLAILVGAVLY